MRCKLTCSAMALVAAALLAPAARAQFEGAGYGADPAGHYASYEYASYNADRIDNVARLQARNEELQARNQELQTRTGDLEAEVARYRSMYQEALENGGGGDGSCGSEHACCLTPANWFDPCCYGPTVAFFVGGDAWRDFSDFDRQDNFGNRVGMDVTYDLTDRVRGHVGVAYGVYDYHGRTTVARSHPEQQIFASAGVYHRASGCCGDVWTWAASYDYLTDNHYGEIAQSVELHQIRVLAGKMVDACNEFGVWAAIEMQDDEYGVRGSRPDSRVEVQDQINLYWRRYWSFGGETMLYGGVADTNFIDDLSFVRLQTRDNDEDYTEVVVGLRGVAPLTCNVGLYGGFHYVVPSASGGFNSGDFASLEENWSVGFGVMWVRGCNLPVLPVADNGWMGKRPTFSSFGD